MTPTTPTPGAEPHQPGEREAIVALARVLVDDAGFDHDDASDMAERLLAVWPDEHRAVDLVAVAKMVRDEQDAALAHLAERRAGDVEAVAKVICDYNNLDGWDDSDEGVRDIFRHQAAQVAALTPTRGVSAEQAWDECLRAVAWAMEHGSGPIGYVREHNPYREEVRDA